MRAVATALARDKYAVAVLSLDEDLRQALCAHLPATVQPTMLETFDELFALLCDSRQDAVVCDLDIAGRYPGAALDAVDGLHKSFPDLPVVIVTRSRASNLRSRAHAAGAIAFFASTFDPHDVAQALLDCLEPSSNGTGTTASRATLSSLAELVGASEPMQRVYEAIQRLAESNATVLIRGESGTGKELAARAIVSLGPRKGKPFIGINCAAIPETLIEAELFGHEKGAFTGADRARPGHFEEANSGTLFLDEIATLDLGLQSKLLRVIEERAVTRLGGSQARKIDFRLITATNEDLEEMVHIGRFREDLYYRINVVPLLLPPLRERREDISLLFDHFLQLACASENMALKRVEPEVIDILEEYQWPGNVREMENLVQRVVVMVSGPAIEPRHLPQQILYASTARQESLLIPEKGIDFVQEMERIEAAYVRAALRRTEGKRKAAAELLGLTERQMKYLCKKHEL